MENNRGLLEKFWEGGCSVDELRRVDRLLDTEAGQQILFELFRRQGMAEPNSAPDLSTRRMIDARKSELRGRISAFERNRRPFRSRARMLVAAAFAGAMILGGAALWRSGAIDGTFDGAAAVELAEISNPGGVPRLHVLADGSQVWLAAGSTLKYPEKFARRHRDVELRGEAFFDVARDERRSFTIRSGDMETRVLGTSFRISAFEGHEHEVAVATGKVSVNRGGMELALLTRGLQMRHDPATGATTRAEVDPASLEEWKSGKLIFDALPMSLVAEQLKARYGIEIDFEDSPIAVQRVNGTFFPDQSADAILRILGFAGNFEHRIGTGEHYTIYQK